MQKRYRFSRRGVLNLIGLLNWDVENKTLRSHAIPPELKVFVALNYFAIGSVLASIATMHRVSNATTSRIIREVTVAIGLHRNEVRLFSITFFNNDDGEYPGPSTQNSCNEDFADLFNKILAPQYQDMQPQSPFTQFPCHPH